VRARPFLFSGDHQLPASGFHSKPQKIKIAPAHRIVAMSIHSATGKMTVPRAARIAL
jgi:hypothetical protein